MSPVEQTMPLAGPSAAVCSATVSISVIIPALNEERMIGRCLESLAQLDFARERFEVIVVDNGSTDHTLEIAHSFQDRLQIRILQKKGVRISGLRNVGARESRGAVLAFLDADCLAPKDWLQRIETLAPVDDAGVLGAHYLLPQDSTWVGRTWHRYHEAEKSGEVSHVPAGDLIMRREDFLRVKGFDESIQTNEDYELCERVRAAGMKVRAFPQIGVVHLGTAQSLRVFFRKQAWHGTHVVRVFLRNVTRSDNLKAVVFAGYTLLSVLAIAAGLAAWALGQVRWQFPAAAIAALFLPPLALSLKQIAGSGRLVDFPALMALYTTYGVARAKALLKFLAGRG